MIQLNDWRLANRDSIRDIRGADVPVIIRVVSCCGSELAGVFDADAPETRLARDNNVGKRGGDARARSVADDPQSFVAHHGYVAESIAVTLVGNASQQESDGRRYRSRSGSLLGAHHWEREKRSQKTTDESFSCKHA
jgi:hypothetical protein